MTKTVELIDIVINKMNLDYDRECVEVYFSYIDIDGRVWEKGMATFFVNLPEPPQEIRDDWFQLPASYFPTLIGLRNDADAAITTRFLI